MKTMIQSLLKSAGIYNRVKASRIYDIYWSVADRTIIDRRSSEIAFYREILPGLKEGDLIFDVGANQGTKVSVFLRLGAKVVAVDPDPHNQQILNDSFHNLRIKKKPVTIVPKAVSDEVGEVTFWVDEPGSAKNTVSEKWVATLREDDTRFGENLSFKNHYTVSTTTLDEMMEEFGCPCFIKIDVEGHEPAVIRGLNRAVPLLSFEVNLPEFLAEGRECIRLLNEIDPSGEFNYVAELDKGFGLEAWANFEDFDAHLRECSDPSIEIFWRT